MGVLRVVLLFSITIMMATFVVWERNKIIEIGYQVAKLQRNCDELLEKNRKINYHVSRLRSPEIIAYKLQIFKLPLIPQEEMPWILVAHQTKSEGNVIKSMKTTLNKDLYTQKGPILNCCSLHN